MGVTLVNAHTHLELSWAGELCPQLPGRPFPDWIHNLVMRWREFAAEGDEAQRTQQAAEAGIAQLVAAGTTHIGDISNTGFSIEPLLASGLSGIVYIEVISLERRRSQERFAWARELLEKYRPLERNGLRIGLTPHAPYSLHPDTLREVAAFCVREDVPLCIHVAESPFENEALVLGQGPIYDLPRRMGGQTLMTVPGLRAIPYLESLGVLAAKPLLVHMVDVNEAELDIVADSQAKVAHCPRSNQLLQCGRMPLAQMLARDIPLAIGTDSLSSSPSLNVREEAATAVSLHHPLVTPQQIEELLTNTAVLT